MNSKTLSSLKERCRHPLPGFQTHRKYAPELAYGRHHGPVPTSAHEAAVILALVEIDGTLKMPLTLRSETVGDHRGQISLPGGRLETNENAWFGALREFQEELGVSDTTATLMAPLTPLYVYASNHRVQPFLALCDGAPKFNPNPAEVAELVWMDVPTLLADDSYHIATMKRGTSLYSAPGFRIGEHFVWGATAMILGEFVELLRQPT